MKTLLSLILCLITSAVFAANPSFRSFDTNDFTVTPSLSAPQTIHVNRDGVTNIFEGSTIILENSSLILTNSVFSINGYTNYVQVWTNGIHPSWNLPGIYIVEDPDALSLIDINSTGEPELLIFRNFTTANPHGLNLEIRNSYTAGALSEFEGVNAIIRGKGSAATNGIHGGYTAVAVLGNAGWNGSVTNGSAVGTLGRTLGNFTTAYGAAGIAQSGQENSTNVGVFAAAMPRVFGSTVNVGVYAEVGNTATSGTLPAPAFTSAALLTENMGTSIPHFVAEENGSAMTILAANPGYTGAGTKALFDDGTYKTVVSGTTINPTDDYLPYRQDATTFADSPLFRYSATALGLAVPSERFLWHPNTFAIAIGHDSLGTDTNNQGIAIGRRSQQGLLADGVNNISIGDAALQGLTKGVRNVAIGNGAGAMTGKANSNSWNVLIGEFTANSVYGDYNIAIGYSSSGGVNLTNVTNSISIGATIGGAANRFTNSNEIVIGNSLHKSYQLGTEWNWVNSSGGRITLLTPSATSMFLGINAGNSSASGAGNAVGIGEQAFDSITTGNGVAIGRLALWQATIAGGNTAVGNSAGAGQITGNNNSYYGNAAGQAHTGNSVTFIGDAAGNSETSTTGNTYVGYFAGGVNVTGDGNIAAGYEAAISVTNMQYSVVIGDHLILNESPNPRHTLADTVWIGSQSGTTTNWPVSVSNAIAIGANVQPRADNAAQIGTNGVSVLYLNGTVGWYRGTGAPAISAPDGSFFTREDGGAGTTFYVREAGSWVSK